MTQEASAHPKQEIGGIVPEVSLPLVSGGKGTLQSFLQGKKGIVVVFWSETCSHCNRYDSYLTDFTNRHPELGLVAIASRHGETIDKIRTTMTNRKLHFPILHDADGSIAKQWYTQQTPRVFLIDSALKLLYRGAIDNYKFAGDPEYQEYLEPAIAAFLAGKPVPRPETASFGCAIQSVYYILPKPFGK
jgi:peroxiredoxin